MTREDRRSSENSSGERRDAPREGERGAKRPVGEKRSDDPRASTEPREREDDQPAPEPADDHLTTDPDEESTSEPTDQSTSESADEEIPLNIVGHGERDPPTGHQESVSFDEAEAESGLDSITGDGDGVLDAPLDEPNVADDDAVEPVELLVQLAKNGEIDPWDIDIVAVTDKFLEALDDSDLRTSGRALFYASVLLRMKSDELFSVAEPDEDELAPWEAPFAEDGPEEVHEPGYDPVAGLEVEMERRLERKHARGKPETLDELVRELRDAERGTWWKESREYDTSNSPRGFNRGVQELSYHTGDDFRVDDEPTANDVTHTAHNEDIEAVIDDVESALTEQYERGRDEVLFAEIEAVGGSRVMTYLALLFLAHRGRVRLEQDELFGDLWIQPVTVEAEPSEAVAD